jgi:hypothetical protein
MMGPKSRSTTALFLLLALVGVTIHSLVVRHGASPPPARTDTPVRTTIKLLRPIDMGLAPIPPLWEPASPPIDMARPFRPPPPVTVVVTAPISPHVKNNVASMARYLSREQKEVAKAWAKNVARGTELDDLMGVFLPRKDGKGGFGVGTQDKPGTPDGIEKMLQAIEAAKGKAQADSDQLREMAFRVQAVAEILEEYPAPKGTPRKYWTEFTRLNRTAAVDFVEAMDSTQPKEIQRAVKALNDACRTCHNNYGGPPIEFWQKRLKTPQIIALMSGNLDAEDRSFGVEEVQIATLTVLAKRAKDRDVAVPAIMQLLMSFPTDVAEVAGKTLETLGETGQIGEPPLDEALKREDVRLRYTLAYEARRLKSPAQACARYLVSPDAELRRKASEWLMLLGNKAGDGEALLRKVQKEDPDPEVRLAAGQALQKIGNKTAFPALLEGLKDADPIVRGRAAQALVKSGAAGVATLRTALKEKDRDVRASAITALGRIGPPANEAAGELRNLSKDEDPLVRRLAADALAKIEREKP